MPRHHPQVFISSSAVAATSPLDALEQVLPITRNIELTGGCSYDPDLLPKLKAFQKSHPVNLLLHSYFPPPLEHFVLNFADTRVQTRDFISHSMEYVQALKIPYYSIHAGFRKDCTVDCNGILHKSSSKVFTLEEIGENVAWFRNKWPDVPLALENIYPNDGDTSCGFMMSFDEICEAMELLPDIFLLLDLGHLKVSANLIGFDFAKSADTILRTYGSRIKEIHMSENHGVKDDHLPITKTSTQLYHVQNYLNASNHHLTCNITLEVRGASTCEIAESYRLVAESM